MRQIGATIVCRQDLLQTFHPGVGGIHMGLWTRQLQDTRIHRDTRVLHEVECTRINTRRIVNSLALLGRVYTESLMAY
ncbi:hypothetical protein J6590_081356 [Homalodisca vitripennis]|nr:hypothetical protein J6590_081356 [Homalodisca vitripennis]